MEFLYKQLCIIGTEPEARPRGFIAIQPMTTMKVKKKKNKKKKNRFAHASAYSNMVGDYCWIDIQVLQEPYQ